MLTKKVGWILGKDKLIINSLSRLEVTQGLRPSCCFYLAHRTATSKVQETSNEVLDNGDPKIITNSSSEQEQLKHNLDLGNNSYLSQGFLLHHRQSSSVVHINKHLEDVSYFFPKSGDVITYKNIFTPETMEQIQTALENDKKEESPALSYESIEDHNWLEQKIDTSKLGQHYMMLSKLRLTGLVVLTSMAGYGMAPGMFDPVTFLFVTLGTALTSASANATNQFLEVPYDSQMNRTKNRVLVRGYLTPVHALSFAAVTGTIGVITLAFGANPLTAGLGVFNWILYTMFYTPMKRMSISNTWVGSVVGAIPPIMGWAACTGGIEPGALLLGAIMYAWQFPHFNALSWNLRPDYSRGGYRMMSVINPSLCKRVALRYCVGMIGLCTLAPVIDLTTWTFACNSLPLNLYFSYLGWRFYRDGDSNSSRKLFRFSLVHLPALLILMIISKKSFKQKMVKRHSEIPVTTS